MAGKGKARTSPSNIPNANPNAILTKLGISGTSIHPIVSSSGSRTSTQLTVRVVASRKPISTPPRHTANTEMTYPVRDFLRKSHRSWSPQNTFRSYEPGNHHGGHHSKYGQESFVPSYVSLLLSGNDAVRVGQNDQVGQPDEDGWEPCRDVYLQLYLCRS